MSDPRVAVVGATGAVGPTRIAGKADAQVTTVMPRASVPAREPITGGAALTSSSSKQ